MRLIAIVVFLTLGARGEIRAAAGDAKAAAAPSYPPAAADVAAVPGSGENPSIHVRSLKVISRQSNYYHGWPTVALRKTGALVLVYSGGRDYHVCPFGRLEMMTSVDEGETWSWPRVVMDSLTDDRDSGIVETKNGVLLASFFTSVAYRIHMNAPERLLAGVFGAELDATLARWRSAEIGATQAERKADVGYWLVRSTDGGKTWSPRYAATPGYCPHGPIALRDGRVFYAAADGRKAAAWTSNDDGLTWTHLGDLPTRAGELHSVEAANGTLIVQVRDKLQTGERVKQRTLQTESRDGGKTWSSPRWVADGYPAHLLRLRDGTLLTTYSWREKPMGIRAKISRDHGQSWSGEIVLTQDAASWDLGYPSTVELRDGGLLTIWYEAPAGGHRAELRQARWELK